MRRLPTQLSPARVSTGLLLALLMAPNLVWLAADPAPRVWAAAILLPLGLFALWFGWLGRVPWLACLLLAPFALLAPLEAWYIAQYHHPTSAQIIATIVASNPLETREYFGTMLVPVAALLLAGLALALLAAWWNRRDRARWSTPQRTGAACIGTALVVLGLGIGLAFGDGGSSSTDKAPPRLAAVADAVRDGYPFGLLPRVVEYRIEWDRMRAQAARYRSFRFGAHRTGPSPQRRQVYVLVIGESSRRADWQLFGYRRATTPELSRLANLVPLRRFITSWPESIAAIPLILTRREPTGAWDTPWPEASILRAMQEAGYETWWISNQQAIGKFDSPVSMYAYEADHVEWLNHASWSAPGSYDGDLVKPLRQALAASGHDLFIVLHMMGSHVKYDYRYPPAFSHWRPTQLSPAGDGGSIERARNSYDNSILYTDHVLAQVIAVLRQSDAITALWYESDHGELIPTATCDKEGHGVGTVPEYEIPALFWYSDGYAREFPHRVAILRANADRRAMSAATFASLVDMAGVTFPGHDETRSLFSRDWHYHTRWVYQNGKVDFDHAVVGRDCQRVEPPGSGATW